MMNTIRPLPVISTVQVVNKNLDLENILIDSEDSDEIKRLVLLAINDLK